MTASRSNFRAEKRFHGGVVVFYSAARRCFKNNEKLVIVAEHTDMTHTHVVTHFSNECDAFHGYIISDVRHE